MFKNLIYNNPTLYYKMQFFKKRIKKFRKTNKFEVVSSINLNTKWNTILFCINVVPIYFVIILVALGVVVGIPFSIYLLSSKSLNTANLVTIITALGSFIGIVYVEFKKRRNLMRDRFDASVNLIIQYLIEIKRENYRFKIYKDDLSFLFMNTPSDILYVLRDIQENVSHVVKKDEKKEKYQEVLNKEILFLIVYIREFYNFSPSQLKYDVEHELIINDLIVNSSKKKKSKSI